MTKPTLDDVRVVLEDVRRVALDVVTDPMMKARTRDKFSQRAECLSLALAALDDAERWLWCVAQITEIDSLAIQRHRGTYYIEEMEGEVCARESTGATLNDACDAARREGA